MIHGMANLFRMRMIRIVAMRVWLPSSKLRISLLLRCVRSLTPHGSAGLLITDVRSLARLKETQGVAIIAATTLPRRQSRSKARMTLGSVRSYSCPLAISHSRLVTPSLRASFATPPTPEKRSAKNCPLRLQRRQCPCWLCGGRARGRRVR